MLEEALQGAAKLHGLGRRQGDCFVVDAKEREIDNSAGTPVVLRDNPNRTYAKLGKVANQLIREHGPLSFLDHVGHFLFQKGPV
jgi:hypothetical protein